MKNAPSPGFTLLELIVAMAILALVISIAMPSLRKGPSDKFQLQTTVNNVLGALRLTRARAIMQNTEATLLVDVDRHTFSSPVVPVQSFSSDITVKLKFAALEQGSPSGGAFRFFPDGSSTGGDLAFSLHQQTMKICVNWLSGEPRQGADC
jgi:general secretion pathway protein H